MRRDTRSMSSPDLILEPLRADPGRAAVLCDIDGTLAPIVDDPDAAAVPAATREVLAGLASRYALVACVSGRRASAARRIVGVDALTYLGNHGLELLEPGDVEPRLDPALDHRGTAAAGFVSRLDAAELSGCGLHLEDKGPIQAIHWRGAADVDAAAQRARELALLAEEEGLVPHLGRMVLEIRPLATVHKGIAVRRLVEEAGAATAIFGGDDRTDLDAFEALRDLRSAGKLDHAICIGVSSLEAPPEIEARTDLMVAGPEGFLELLRSL
jgi:trehalose 6-phosphate phosphatase